MMGTTAQKHNIPLKRPKASSSFTMSQSADPSRAPASILRRQPPPPPPRDNGGCSDVPTDHGVSSASQRRSTIQHVDKDAHHNTDAARRKKKKAARKRGSINSACSTSSLSSLASKKKGQGVPKKGAVSSELTSDNNLPNFDVLTFEQLAGSSDANLPQAFNISKGSIYSLSSRPSQKQKKNRKGSKSNLDGYGSDASKMSDTSKRSWRSQQTESSRKSWMSHQTEATYSSVFTNTCFKLKGFNIKDYKPKKKGRDHSSSSQFSSSEGEVLSCALGGAAISTRKNPRFRGSSKYSSGSGATVTTAASSHNEKSPRRKVSFSSDGSKAQMPSIQKLEEQESGTKTSVFNNLQGQSISVATKGSQDVSANAGDADATRVFDLPWVDNASGGKLHGLYSGPINDRLQPHGDGTLILEGNSFLKFYGHWNHGALVSPLRNEEEQREIEKKLANANANKSFDDLEEEYKKKKEHRKKSSKEYRKKPSKQYRKKLSKDHSVSTFGSSLGSSLSPDHFDEGPGQSNSSQTDAPKSKKSCRSKPKYALGEVAHTPRDMVILRDNEQGINSASLLKKYDQAFLKRSNGLWTCAVLADKALQPTTSSSSHWYTKHEIDRETMELEESMLFVINEDGATKIVKRRHWGRFVRRVLPVGGKEGDC